MKLILFTQIHHLNKYFLDHCKPLIYRVLKTCVLTCVFCQGSPCFYGEVDLWRCLFHHSRSASLQALHFYFVHLLALKVSWRGSCAPTQLCTCGVMPLCGCLLWMASVSECLEHLLFHLELLLTWRGANSLNLEGEQREHHCKIALVTSIGFLSKCWIQ